MLESTERVRGLARAILQDEHLAEDVAQQTLIAALESPPRVRWRPERWLEAVARNFARLTLRESKRRRGRERRVARAEALPPPPDPCELEELKEKVTEAILALREPYRSTVILRYYEDLSSPEIARREGIPPNTVRVRLKRARGLLQRELDGLYNGDRRRWCAGMALLAGLEPGGPASEGATGALETAAPQAAPARQSTGDTARSAGQPARRSTGRSPPWRGRRLTVPLSAALIFLAAVIVLLKWPPGSIERAGRPDARPGAASSSEGAAVARLEIPAPRDPDPRAAATSPGAPSQVAERQPPPPTDLFPILVIDGASGRPVAGAEVFVGDFNMRSVSLARGRTAVDFLMQPFCTRHAGVTDREGRVAVSRAWLRGGRIAVSAAGFMEYRERARIRRLSGPEHRVELEAPLAATLRVLGPEGTPISGVEVSLRGTKGTLRRGITDTHGTFSISLEDSDLTVALEAEGFAAVQDLVEAPLTEVRLVPGHPATGRVLDHLGKPVEGCEVTIGSSLWRGDGWRVLSDADGLFETMALPGKGGVTVELAHPEFPTLRLERELPWEETWKMELLEGALVEGRITAPRGGPAATGVVRLLPGASPFYSRDLAEAPIEEDGSFRVGPVTPGSYCLAVEHPLHSMDELEIPDLRAGESRRVSVRLRRGWTISGRALTPRGAPVGGVRMVLGTICGDEVRGREAISLADGSFSFEGMPEELLPSRPVNRDLRWTALLGEELEGSADGWILEVLRPHDLLRKNDREIPRFGLLGSRNTCRVLPRETGIELIIAEPMEAPGLRFRLVDRAGTPMRAVTNLLVVPPGNPRERVAVFGGTTANPVNLHDPEAIDGALVGILTRRYATPFLRVRLAGHEGALEAILEPRRSLLIRVEDAAGGVLPGIPVLCGPVLDGQEPFAAVVMGSTGDDGSLPVGWLASGQYRIFRPREPGATRGLRPRSSFLPVSELRPLGSFEVRPGVEGVVPVRVTTAEPHGGERKA
ncbi:MAG: sigma-70 family RNA polymerase sigma factor [Planctomycetota bacterium]